MLANAGADLVACETVPSFAEARALARLIEATPDLWGWISFSCRDGQRISDGTPLRECVAFLDGVERIAGVGINCTAPQHVSDLIAAAAAATDKPVLVYPNSGQTWDPTCKQWVGARDTDDLAVACVQWHRLGARVIGGCCGTRPDGIRRIRAALMA